MRFSVVVPIYKVEKFLPQCVDSILAQSYKDFELILVDDGSPDRCPEICDEYAKKDSRVKVIHKVNGGLSDARNTGLRAATGDYMLFMDSDDYWITDKTLEKISALIDEYQADIVAFGSRRLFHKDNELHPGRVRNLEQYNGMTTSEVLSTLVTIGRLTISACTMSTRRQFLIDNELFFVEGIKTEDLEWAVRVFSAMPKWSFTNEHFYVYRMQRDGSITASVDFKHLRDYCWILETCIERVENGREEVKIPLMSYLTYHVLIASALAYRTKLNKAERHEILSRLKPLCKGRIIKYTLNKKVKLASMVYRAGGFALMAKVLGFYLINRGH